jgi:hypothetical protein
MRSSLGIVCKVLKSRIIASLAASTLDEMRLCNGRLVLYV